MEVTSHIEALSAEGARMAAAADLADPDADVPTCPEWTVRDLVRHTGGVHRWATAYVAGACTEAHDVDFAAATGPEPEDTELVAWFRQGHGALVDALSAAPADLECWTFLPAPSPRAMWARRQAHETAIHRVDAELAAGVAVTPFAPPFAADGIDELLTCFTPRRLTNPHAPTRTVEVHCLDDGATWSLCADGEGVVTETLVGAGRGDPASTCTVKGSAGDLYLALWNRTDPGMLSVDPDPDALTLFGGTTRVHWA